jgi:hypothetical protein
MAEEWHESVCVDNVITYLNTDLDLVSEGDLTALAAAFEAGAVRASHVTQVDGGLWYATFNTDEQHTEPEPNISAMIAVIESLSESFRSDWDRSQMREFNIGYDCGAEPWSFNHGLSASILGRIAAANASLRITLYPDRTPTNAHYSLPADPDPHAA